ncbi:MAG: UDP-N-acetylmuramoyl-L-alanine--D-glutamate ligase [Culturomica sp.]|jgi:UDP-N-acetylmuramoylalanine--D-glutamate ligase|nr:UDP-N-acetylmuramoyl-L-alanine--D-glutamate ligase [Culturomica sp.]
MKLVILGAKESGVGAAALGKKLGYDVFLSDSGKIEGKYKQVLDEKAITYEEGGHTEEKVLAADLVVKSPGIPDTAPLVKTLRQHGIEVISEIELAGRNSGAKMICITGSNGKTTTTLLTHHLLSTSGMDVGLAGNVGYSLAAQVAEDAHPAYVVELSSFQLDGMTKFKADIAVITNITPDHLDRYDHKFENYAASKFRILQNMDADGLFIYGADCPMTSKLAASSEIVPPTACFTYSDAENIPVATQNLSGYAYMEGNVLTAKLGEKTFTIDKNKISIKGRHNVYNAMAAVITAMKVGIDNEKIAEGLQSFPQVPHRMETVGEHNGIIYINDSKATNVDSSWYALDSMTTPVVWIAGGTDKGNDYSPLFGFAKEKVKVLICMGLDNAKLINSFGGLCPVVSTASLADAMREVEKYATSGDTVLLSPCCASFDLFKNYEDRGDKFRQAVKELINR